MMILISMSAVLRFITTTGTATGTGLRLDFKSIEEINQLDPEAKSSLLRELNCGQNSIDLDSDWSKISRRLTTLKAERCRITHREVSSGLGAISFSVPLGYLKPQQPKTASPSSPFFSDLDVPTPPNSPPAKGDCNNTEEYMFSFDDGVSKYCSHICQSEGDLFSCVVSSPKYLLFAVLDDGCDISSFTNPRSRLTLTFACVSFAMVAGVMLQACSCCQPAYSRVISPSSDLMWTPNQLMTLEFKQITGVVNELTLYCTRSCKHTKVLLEVPSHLSPSNLHLPMALSRFCLLSA